MKIDLPSLARANGVRRKSVRLRPIRPTQVQSRDLYRVYLPAVSAWERLVSDRLMPEYARTIASIQTDSIIDLEAIIKFIEDAVSVVITTDVRSGMQRWLDNMTRWHYQRFVANLKYATDLELGMILNASGSPVTMQVFMARNTALIRDVSDQLRGRVSDIVFRNVPLRTPIREVAKEISEATGLARKRSMRIAMDQTQKISASLDRERMLSIGITQFEWVHSGKAHPRPEHLARNGKVYDWSSEIARTDPPGHAPFCGCKARGIL